MAGDMGGVTAQVSRGRWFRGGTTLLALAAVFAAPAIASNPADDDPSVQPVAASTVPKAEGRTPNVVLVLTDDLSRDLVSRMPAVAAMKRQGWSASRYIVSSSLCCPSRVSLLTGRYAHNTGVWGNRGPRGGLHVFRANNGELSTISTDLESAGYRTGLFGKYVNGYSVATRYVPPGWTNFVSTGDAYDGFDYRLNVDGVLVEHGDRPADYATDVLRRHALDFIRTSARADEPFFAQISTYAPHSPYVPAPRHRKEFPKAQAPRGASFGTLVKDGPSWLDLPKLTRRERDQIDRTFRKRVRSVQAIDDVVRRVRATLKEEGVAGNTFVVVTSDNGYHLGQHRLRTGKQTAFESDIRVPLVVTGPGVPGGVVSDAITQNIDLRPTFATAAGIAVPAEVDGASLLDLWQGRSPISRTAALIEHDGPSTGDDPDTQPPLSGRVPAYAALRTAWSTYVEYGNGEREYYDLVADRAQNTNAYASLEPEVMARLHEQLAALSACAGATCRQ